MKLLTAANKGLGCRFRSGSLGRSGEFARRELSDFCDQTDFLDRSAVMKLMQSGQGRDVWFLLNFALWWKEFIEGAGSGSAHQVESMAAAR